MSDKGRLEPAPGARTRLPYSEPNLIIRRSNTTAWQIPTAATIRHRGRKSGRQYVTVVNAFRKGKIVAIPLSHGQITWVNNVLASGEADIHLLGRDVHIVNPRVLPVGAKDPTLPIGAARAARGNEVLVAEVDHSDSASAPSEFMREVRRSLRGGSAAQFHDFQPHEDNRGIRLEYTSSAVGMVASLLGVVVAVLTVLAPKVSDRGLVSVSLVVGAAVAIAVTALVVGVIRRKRKSRLSVERASLNSTSISDPVVRQLIVSAAGGEPVWLPDSAPAGGAAEE